MLTLGDGFIGDGKILSYKDNFFSDEVINALAKNTSDSRERKREFQLGSIPSNMDALSEAIEFAREETNIQFNTAILKEYRPGDDSGAYDWHVDPDRFFGGPLGICTLDGKSELGIRDGRGFQIDIMTVVNRLIIADSKLEHRASPPINENKKRSFLFLGVKT